MGSGIEKIFSRPDLPKVRQILAKCFPETLELEVLTRQGPANHMCRFVPIRLDSGEPCGMTLSISTKHQLIDIAKHVGGNYAKYSFDDIKGESPKLKAQIDLSQKAAVAGYRVLLYGESGTGKELFAQSIHNSGRSNKGPFVAISCAAIPRDLIESELFGYVGGAFTGARKNGMIGKMELATGGTLFLDEINSLPLEMQAKLLRVLQQMEIVRIGDTKPTPIDARIIAATNQNLREAVRQGLFREDLYFRLNVVEITIPPLRERNEDIALLVHTFLRRQSYETSIPFAHISADAMNALYSYSWPGNVRELDNTCERALLMAGGGVINLEHLPPHIAAAAFAPGVTGINSMPGTNRLPGKNPAKQVVPPGPTEQTGLTDETDAANASPAFRATGVPEHSGYSADYPGCPHHRSPNEHGASGQATDSVNDTYRNLVVTTLERYQGNISKAAEHLGIARTTLYRKIKKFGLDV